MPDPAKEHGRGYIAGQRDILERLSGRLRALSATATVEDAMRELGTLRATIEGQTPETEGGDRAA